MNFVGIDVSKSSLDAASSDGQRLNVTGDELSRLLSWIGKRRPELVVLEATGGYDRRQGLGGGGGSTLARCATSPSRRVGSPRPTRSMRTCWPPLPKRCGPS